MDWTLMQLSKNMSKSMPITVTFQTLSILYRAVKIQEYFFIQSRFTPRYITLQRQYYYDVCLLGEFLFFK